MVKLFKKAASYVALVMGFIFPALFILFLANMGGIDIISLCLVYLLIAMMYLLFILNNKSAMAGIFAIANTYLLYKVLLVEWSVTRIYGFGEVGVPLHPMEQAILTFIVISGVIAAVLPIWLKAREHLKA